LWLGVICLVVVDCQTGNSVLDCVYRGCGVCRCRRNFSFAVRGTSAWALSCDRLAWLCRHRSPNSVELDQPDAGTARHLRNRAAASACHRRGGPRGLSSSFHALFSWGGVLIFFFVSSLRGVCVPPFLNLPGRARGLMFSG